MILFLIIGIIGLILVIVPLVIGDVFEGLFDGFDAGGALSGPVIGAFLAAFGFGAALILQTTSASTSLAALGGLGSGIVIGGLSAVITRSVMSMPTDANLRSEDLVGATGTVITRIPEGGMGEISVSHNGQVLKLGARSTQPVASGKLVTITATTSTSSVVVTPQDSVPTGVPSVN